MNTPTHATASTPSTDETAEYTDRLTLEMPTGNAFDELVLPEFTNTFVPIPELTRHATGSNLNPLPADQEQTPIREFPAIPTAPGAPIQTFDDMLRSAEDSLVAVSRQLFGNDIYEFDDPMDVVDDDAINVDEFEAINNAIQNGFVNTERGGARKDFH
jgi:hypothetical protein